LNGSLNKFRDHGFFCFVWINFDKEDACQNEDSNKSFIELLNSNFAQPHSKNLCGFMVNMLIHFPWDCGFELAQVHMFTCMCNCVCAHINKFLKIWMILVYGDGWHMIMIVNYQMVIFPR
jgi:hypothetical protein